MVLCLLFCGVHWVYAFDVGPYPGPFESCPVVSSVRTRPSSLLWTPGDATPPQPPLWCIRL